MSSYVIPNDNSVRRPSHNDSIDMASPQWMSSYDLSDNNSERRPSHNDIIDMASPQCMSSYDLTDNNYLISPFNIYFIIWLHTIVYNFLYFYIVSFENILSQYVHWCRLPSLCVLNDSQAQYRLYMEYSCYNIAPFMVFTLCVFIYGS